MLNVDSVLQRIVYNQITSNKFIDPDIQLSPVVK